MTDFRSAISLAVLAAVIATPALAQETEAQAPASSGGIEEIVVTAQKRSENVQDVPIAISAFTATALQERAVTSVASLSSIAPNVTLDAGTPFSGSSAVLSAFIRGIGANDFAFNIDPGVGIYLDGVYLARSVGANQELADVERIEVLKGPQGTLFGRNTIGGAISIVTHDPGKEFRFNGDVTTGSFAMLQVRGTADVPLAESLSSSISFSMKNRKGYQHRIPFPGFNNLTNETINSFKAAGYQTSEREGGDNSWSTRGKLKWDNGGAVRVTLTGDYSDIDQSAIANTVIATTPAVFAGFYNCAIEGTCPGPLGGVYAFNRGGLTSTLDLPPIYGVNADSDPLNDRLPYDDRFVTNDIDKSYANGNSFSKLKNYGGAGTIDFDLTDEIALKSITAYRELHWVAGMDLDGSPLNFLHTSFSMNQWQFSQELQLLGKALDDKINYVLGAYYFKEKGDLHDYVTFAEGLLQVDGPNDLATKNYAAFGQVDFRPTDLIGITIGGRYTHENKEFQGFQSDNNGMDYKIGYMLGLPGCTTTPAPTESCRVTMGYPNPGEPLRYYIAGVQKKKFNNFSPKIGVQLHPTEDVMAYGSWSRGYKTGGWTTRLSAPLPYAPDFDEEKAETWEVGVKSTWLDRRLQVNAAAFTTKYKGIQLNFQQGTSPTVQNAGDARIKGFEVEVVAAPVDGFTVNASLGYLDAKYTDVLLPAQVAANPFQAGVFPGANLPKTPKWKINVSPRYEVDLGDRGSVVLLADWTHSTKLWNDTERAYLLERPATDLVNASITYKEPGDKWELTVGGTNLTDERYLVTGQAQIAGGQFYGTYSRPAEWYARFGVKF